MFAMLMTDLTALNPSSLQKCHQHEILTVAYLGSFFSILNSIMIIPKMVIWFCIVVCCWTKYIHIILFYFWIELILSLITLVIVTWWTVFLPHGLIYLLSKFKLRICIMTLFWFFWSPESEENGFHHFWSI